MAQKTIYSIFFVVYNNKFFKKANICKKLYLKISYKFLLSKKKKSCEFFKISQQKGEKFSQCLLYMFRDLCGRSFSCLKGRSEDEGSNV